MEGFDKKQIKRALFAVQAVVVIAVIVLIAASGFYTVKEQEQAVVTQFGKVVSVRGAGAHFKIPLVHQVIKVDTTNRGMEFGYSSHGSSYSSIENESFMITHDFNFVVVDFYIEWKVSDPAKFTFKSQDPILLLRNIIQSEARSVVSNYLVDDVLTTAKSEIQTKVKEGVAAKLEEYDLGMMVLNVSLQDASPPTSTVTAAFKEVENAKQNRETQINYANSYYKEVIPAARAEADKIIKEAEAVKESRENEAIGEVARFNEMYAEYAANKELTKTRMYLEAMEEILPGITTYIESGGDLLKFLNMGTGSGNAPNNQNTDEGSDE